MKPKIYKQFLLKFYEDKSYKVCHYFDKNDIKRARKEENVAMLFQINAEKEEDIVKMAEEFLADVKRAKEEEEKTKNDTTKADKQP